DDDATVYSRMFGPFIGIPEDPATGAASGPLGAYLFQHNAVSADNASRLLNLQGVRMGRPGRIYISLSSRAGVLEEVRVGGEPLFVGKGPARDKPPADFSRLLHFPTLRFLPKPFFEPLLRVNKFRTGK